MANREKIIARLQEHLNYVVSQGISQDRILGIFLYGSQNYHLDNEDSDVDSKIIYIPTFEEMCLQKEWKSKEYHYENEHIEVKDIREMRIMFMKQNINFLEILYTTYFILNPKYESLWNTYFVDNNEDIAHYDITKVVKSISGQLLHTLHQAELYIDNKKLANCYRLYEFLKNYMGNVDYLHCINTYLSCTTKTYNFIYELKFGISDFSHDLQGKMWAIQVLKEDVENCIQDYPIVEIGINENAAAALDRGVTEILRYACIQPLEIISKEQFFENLTHAEIKAYYSIVSSVGYEGSVSVSKLIELNTISRPVYNSLFNKMKEMHIANITNQGVKGTYIEIIQPELKAEATMYYKG